MSPTHPPRKHRHPLERGLKAEVWQGENGSVRVRFGQGAGQETEIRFVQNVADPQAEGHAAQGAAPDGVFIPAPDGSEVEAGAPLRAVIEIQEQSQGGSTFLLGHELAHNLLDVLRRTGTLTAEQDAALTEHFRDEAGAFDEEAFADAFGLELRNAFTEQENARLAERPKTRIGQLLRTLADAVRLWARALTAWRKTRAEAPTAAKGTPATVLDAFLAKQPLPTEQTTGNATEATDTTADTTPEGAEAQPAPEQAETAQATEATPEQGTEAPAEEAAEAQTAHEEEATPDATPEAAEAEAKPVPEAERKLDGMTEEEAVKEAREGCDDEDYEAPWHDLDAYADVLENEDGAFAATYVPLDEKKFGATGLSTEIPFEHTAPTDKESFLSAQDEIDGISTCLPGLEGSTFMLLRKTSAGITVYGERARDIVDALENKEIEHNSNIERIDEKIDEGKETPDGDTYDESWYRVTVKGRKNVAKLIGGLLDEGNVAVLSDGSDDVEVYVPQAYAKDLTTFEEAQAENEAARKEYDAELSKRMDEAEAEVRERYRKAFGEAPEATGGQPEAKYHIPVQKSVVDAMEGLANGKPSITLHNAEYGKIEYPLGKMGKGGHGLLHIVERRMEEGHTLDESVEIAIRVGESAERGKETAHIVNTRHFDKEGVRAIVAFTKDGNPIITGYEISAEEQKGTYSDAPSVAAPQPHARSEEVVAALKEKIAQLRSEEQPKYHIPKPQAPGFSESAEGKRVVAAVLDALMAADPAMVLDKAGKARTKESFAEAVEAQAQAPDAGGTKAAREALARLGELRGDLSEAAWEDVLATAYEVCERFGALAGAAASKIEAGKLTERMAEYLRELSRNRATELGRRAYFAGREFAWRQARAAMRAAEEAARRKGAAALEELRRRRAADAEAYRWELADERFLADYRAAKARAMADKRVAALRREMEETLKAMRLRQARKDAARREDPHPSHLTSSQTPTSCFNATVHGVGESAPYDEPRALIL